MKNRKQNKSKNQKTHTVRRHIAKENTFLCKWRKAKTCQAFSFPEAYVYKCEKLKDISIQAIEFDR